MSDTPETTPPVESLTYADAGVDIDAGQHLVTQIKSAVARTKRPEVLSSLGGFAGLFALPSGFEKPVLVATTDGVGTKLKLALAQQQHSGIGIDLVAMCVNDLIVMGAEPLFFLDYYASGRLDVAVAKHVVNSIADGCQQAGMALLGGETAEMPGVYRNQDYDLAGFCVGVVDQAQIIDGSLVKPGHALIGLASSGPHANGYSLIRKIIDERGIDLATPLAGAPLHQHLLAPTRIYARLIKALRAQCPIHAMAHITGGGLIDNLPRVLPENTEAVILRDSLPQRPIFQWLAEQGPIEDPDMFRTFNCGVGLVLCVPEDSAQHCLNTLAQQGEQAFLLGHIAANTGAPKVVIR